MKRILIQFDTDPAPSVFDRVVAVDSDVDELFSYGGITPENVTGLVHGAIFTRGPADLKNTAIFVGGSNVEAGEKVLKKITEAFFGPMRVSVMMDSNGSNTTAAAAVQAAARHLDLKATQATILGGTGPVGYRAAQILASQGASVRLVSRDRKKAENACEKLLELNAASKMTAADLGQSEKDLLQGSQLLIAAGAAGVKFLSKDAWESASDLRVAIDLNAVPPAGLEGINVTDKAVDHGPIKAYGAIGVGGLKMKIHKAAIRQLFEANDRVLDTSAIFGIASQLG